jgi:hypothetical protein
VAILLTSSFDATTVDPASMCFGDAESPAERDCIALNRSIEDVNGDGRPDLMLHFKTKQTGIDPGNTQACLTGMTFSGVSIEGCDSIKTLLRLHQDTLETRFAGSTSVRYRVG